MKIECFEVGIAGANCYLVINEATKECIAVDPGGTSAALRDYLNDRNLNVKAVILTHGHFDHIMGITDMIGTDSKEPVYVYVDDQDFLKDENLNASKSFVQSGYVYPDGISVIDGQELELIGFTFQVIHTPGHTPGSCCYYMKEEKVLFSGDTLFKTSIGRTDLAGGSDEIYASIKERLFTLPEEVEVYPGHMSKTTIGYEKKYNPYVRS
ncbi:MBL fold metallo-hydrolase [Ohessyouella blattaphilus]|uniref:MBL fold metallo-hydrolase n=1 Tax=Ohessyouella blattaphilus TaxID=2949333 RepID=A0ABT1EHK1_9FIRM|nr:MBL fold metallo-hydrolase [Ohessyouella blattaphilus]MCP1110143.1 MBL fold metallo-hydrolase [Ohessyouella blattaphilus]MCR8563537.1 MBL fold metallo-hydrolase [Ohessyouella blattaphilus]